MLRRFLAILALTAGAASQSHAGIITLSAVDSGSYRSTGAHDPLNQNYIAGNTSDSSGPRIFRNFFVFDLSSVTGTIVSAQLKLFNPDVGFASLLDTSETYTLFDVSTSIATLTTANGAGTGVSVFDDLGTGTSYGSHTFAKPGDFRIASLASMTLNSSAVASLNSATSLWAIGGANTTLRTPPAAFEFMFGFTGPLDTRQLVLETQDVNPVPEPASLALFSLGAMGLAGYSRRRRAAPPADVQA